MNFWWTGVDLMALKWICWIVDGFDKTLWIFSWTLLFRIQVNGFPVFGVGQPTEEGFLATLNKARALKWPILWYRWRQCNVLWWFERLWYTWRQCSMVILKVATSAADPPEKFIWFNVRKEPVVYINGAPASPRWWWWYGVFWIINIIMMTMTHMCRDPKELHKNIDTTGSVDQLDYLEQVRKILFRYIANMTFVLSIFINESFTVSSWVGHWEGREGWWGD